MNLTGAAVSCGTVVLLHPRQEPGAPSRGSLVTEHFEAGSQVPWKVNHFIHFDLRSFEGCPGAHLSPGQGFNSVHVLCKDCQALLWALE